jgi:hypothetical protein
MLLLNNLIIEKKIKTLISKSSIIAGKSKGDIKS